MRALSALVSGFLVAASLAGLHQRTALAQSLDRETGAITMVGGYLGMAEFCTAYGIDFRPTASLVRDGFRQNVFPDYTDPRRMAFDAGVRFGTRGIIYSPQAGDYLNVVTSGTDVRQFCRVAHQQTMQISQTK